VTELSRGFEVFPIAAIFKVTQGRP